MKADGVILNPRAGGGAGAGRWAAVRATERARELGLERAALFDGAGVAADGLLPALSDWLCARTRAGARRFVVAGGDGTVNLALGAWMDLKTSKPDLSEAVFGAIGIGSSNDFHKPFEAPGRSRVAGRPARLDFAAAFAHDCGRASTSRLTRWFFVNASMGVTAEANASFNRGAGLIGLFKPVWTDGAILSAALSTFVSYKDRPVTISVDGAPARALSLTNLGVIKNRHFSGSFRYDSGPAADDGWFGVRVCEGMSRSELVAALAAFGRGRFTGRPKTFGCEARRVAVESVAGEPLAIELDGEVVRASACVFEVRSREIKLCP